jgi:hypothetical protein
MELHRKTTPHAGHAGEQLSAGSPTPRCLMIGGFLGAGKTTAVSKLAAWLGDRGTRVGLIVNDQGLHLVDREVLADRGFPVEEIPGGCFCCRFDALIAEADPGILGEAGREAFAARAHDAAGITLEWEHLEAFKPGRPQPTHRITAK